MDGVRQINWEESLLLMKKFRTILIDDHYASMKLLEQELQQERARSQKLQQELSQRQSNNRQTPIVEDAEDDSLCPIYGEEDEDEKEEA
ncbi:hypothetical protein P8452_59570 [Trifolium repens]|nr:hypothetical protein P8452_59570 [Trifolium repens]